MRKRHASQYANFGSLPIAVIRPNPFFRPYVIPCHPKPNPLTVSENAQIRFILRFILLFSYKSCSVKGGIGTSQYFSSIVLLIFRQSPKRTF